MGNMGTPGSFGDIEPDAAQAERIPDPHVFVRLAEAYLKEGLPDEAIKICRDGLATDPGYAGGRVLLARALLERGSLDDAEHECRRVLLQAPEHVPALRCLGEICARQGRAEEARRYSERGLRLEPRRAETPGRLAGWPVTPETGPVEPAAQTPGRNRDPLATPTLASLYASQGYTDVAQMIYSQVGQQRGETAPPSPSEDMSGKGTPASRVLERLLALREAVRKHREVKGPDGRPDRSHER
jgi:tetratricopeptide (TPR) repeat protein